MANPTVSLLAPGGIVSTTVIGRSGTSYAVDANGVATGVSQYDAYALIASGWINLGVGTFNTAAAAWNSNQGAPSAPAAAGATIGTAKQLTSNRNAGTCTLSSQGFVFKAVGTGAETWLGMKGTKGVKYYAPPNATMDALSTGTATQLAAGKGAVILQTGAFSYVTKIKGA